jgi:mannose-6-phosphate isomerase
MTDSLPDLIPLQPYLREMVWGGRRLEGLFGKRLPPVSPIGEAWEVSGYPDQESTVASGPLAGRGLGELLHQFGADLVGDEAWGRFGETFPLLIKLIDAHVDLSIQVHPDDDYARREGLGQFGKSEAWVVLYSEGGQTALGLKEGIDRQEFNKALDAGRALDVVQFQDVTPGDVIFVPPGTVHAANAGIVIYEVQQPSDLTFASTTTIAPVSTARRGSCTSSAPSMSSTSRARTTSSVISMRRRVPPRARPSWSIPTTSDSASPPQRAGRQHITPETRASR